MRSQAHLFTYWLALAIEDRSDGGARRRAFDAALTRDPSYREVYSSSAFVVFESGKDLDHLYADISVPLDALRASFLLHGVGRLEAKAFGLPMDHELFQVLDYLTSGRGN